VHRPFREQGKDGCADVTASATTTTPTTATRSTASATGPEARTEAEAAATARTEPGSPASPGSGAGTELVFELFAHLALGFAAGVVQGTPAVGVHGVEAEPADLWAVVLALEWVSHVCVSILIVDESAVCTSDVSTIYRNVSRCNH
jgi:hypothetical protein